MSNVWVTPQSKKARIAHLVVDTNAFIDLAQMHRYGETLYTTPSVIAEIRDVNARRVLETLPIEIKIEEPDAESLKRVSEFAALTGDLRSISKADLAVLALTYALEVRVKGSATHLRTTPHQEGKAVTVQTAEAAIATTEQPAAAQSGAETKNDLFTEVGCMTNDFPMQNIAAQMGMRIIGTNGKLIKRLKQYVLECHACYMIVNDTTTKFCPRCGHGDTLRKIGVKIDKWGVPHYTRTKGQAVSTRGTNQPLPKPRGGLHHQEVILSVDVDPAWHQKKNDRVKQRRRAAAAADPGLTHFELAVKGPATVKRSRRTEQFGRGRGE